MNWFEIHHFTRTGEWVVYKVTDNGNTQTRFKTFKTEAAAKTFGRKHWVRRWSES